MKQNTRSAIGFAQSKQENEIILYQPDEAFFVRSTLQPKEGVFFNGQIFDAYALVADLIRQTITEI